MKKSFLKFLVGVLLSLASISSVAEVNNIYVLGDSISDGGGSPMAKRSLWKNYPEQFSGDNHANGYHAACSFQKRFTNGFTAVEQAAAVLGRLEVGRFENYAVGGQAAYGDLWDQTSDLLDEDANDGATFTKVFNSDDLVIIEMGANDFARYVRQYDDAGNAIATSIPVSDAVNNAMGAYMTTVERLLSHGARNIIVMNVYDLVKIPAAQSLTQADKTNIEDFVSAYNQALSNLVNPEAGYSGQKFSDKVTALGINPSEVNISYYNFNQVVNWLWDAKTNLDQWPVTLYYADSEIVTECQGNINANFEENDYRGLYNWPSYDRLLYWDKAHFGRRGHLYFGNMLADFINTHY